MKKIKVSIYIALVLLILCTIIIPIIMYSHYISGEISHKNQDWAAFGSFIGGLYSSVFSFASVAILVYSLYLTQKNSKEQLSLQRSEQTTAEFNMLLNILENEINKRPILYRDKDGISAMLNRLYHQMATYCYKNDSVTRDNINKSIWNNASHFFKIREDKKYDNEIALLKAIMYRVYNANHSLVDAYKVIFKNKISSDARFLVRLYSLNTDPVLEEYFSIWTDFAEIPEQLTAYVNSHLDINGK